MDKASAPELAVALAPLIAIAHRALPPQRRDEMIAAACLIAPWTVHPDGHDVGGALCADGTPLEASVAFDPRGGVELRLVGDIGAGIAASDVAQRRHRVIERCARFAGPGDAGAMVAELAARHIEWRPPTARALAFVGAGASAQRPFHKMFYFGFAGMAPAAAQTLVARHADAAVVERLWALATQAGLQLQGVGYDLEGGRITKLQIYARFAIDAGQDMRQRLSQIGDEDIARCADMMAAVLPAPVAPSSHHLLGLGVATEGGAAGRMAPRLYAPLPAHGIDRMADLQPGWTALASRWRTTLPEATAPADACTPTLLSLSSAAGSERCAVYFSLAESTSPS